MSSIVTYDMSQRAHVNGEADISNMRGCLLATNLGR